MKENRLVKYTLMPTTEDENYDKYFLSSLKELASKLNGSIVAPLLVIYNSELDIPIEYDYEEYTMYCNSDQILDVIKKAENTDSFGTLIVHGFSLSLDDLREKFVPIGRRNEAHICLNVLSEYEIPSNLSLYLDKDIDREDDEVWEQAKDAIEKQIEEFMEEYDEAYSFDFDEDDFSLLEDFLNSLYNASDEDSKDSKDKSKTSKSNATLIDLFDYLDEEEEKEDDKEEDVIAFTYQNKKDYIALSCIDGELYVIDDDECEILLTEDQMDFLIDAYNRIIKNKDK